MKPMRRCMAALVLAVIAGPAAAQVIANAGELLDPAGVRPLQWSEWITFHQRLGARLDAGELALDADRRAAAQAARADLLPLLDPAGDFERLSPRAADALVAAHNRLADAVGFGDDQLLQCSQRQPLGTRRRVTECRTAGADADARARARADLQRIRTRAGVDG